MNVLIVDDSPERANRIRTELERWGCKVHTIGSPQGLLQAVESSAPDVIVIDTESPVHDVLEQVVGATRERPKPIVMFSSDGGAEAIQDAVRAGVSSYIVDGRDPKRVKSIIDVAMARFEEQSRLVDRLADANRRLTESKTVDQAKALLMKSRGLSESEAYHYMRRAAMDRGRRLPDLARQILDLGDLIG